MLLACVSAIAAAGLAAPAPGWRVRLYDNTALTAPAVGDHTVNTSVLTFTREITGGRPAFSAAASGMLALSRGAGWYYFKCEFVGTTLAAVWVDGHQVCHDGHATRYARGDSDNPISIKGGTRSLPLRARVFRARGVGEDVTTAVTVMWSFEAAAGRGRAGAPDPPQVIPAKHLSRDLPASEAQRDALQVAALTGWGLWNHNSLTDVALLPQGCLFAVMLCRADTNACITSTRIEEPAKVRVGPHAADRSYLQFYFGALNSVAANVSVEMGTTGDARADMTMLITPVADPIPDGGWGKYTLRLVPRYAWLRDGDVSIAVRSSTGDAVITFTPWAMDAVTLSVPASRAAVKYTHLNTSVIARMWTHDAAAHVSTAASLSSPSNPFLEIPLATAQPVVLSTSNGPAHNAAAARTWLDAQRTAHEQALAAAYGTADGDVDGVEVATVIEAAVMWNVNYNPFELGPVIPVSRKWNFVPVLGGNEDFDYVIFDWDNFFATLLAAPFDKALAYSNLVQVVKSKTATGFVPNWSALGKKSEDRTEPPVGAKVLLEMYKKFRDTWLVELLFDDLLDWSNWFLDTRTVAGVDPPLIQLGSYNPVHDKVDSPSSDPGGSMRYARLESGMDNSPMYDGEFFNKTTHLMELYDVGMNSLFVADADALAELADAISRAEASMLRARADRYRRLITAHLWDEASTLFVNRYTPTAAPPLNNTFNRRVSPTSFYALMARAATDDQADALLNKWFFSPDHFCIARNGDFAGNTDACYYGLPSIDASDAAFKSLGYWRGFVWGPTVQLTYWGLAEYATSTARQARKALASQMSSLLVEQWRRNRHVCENFHPHKGHADCSGTTFYHWGALNGLIALREAGLA